MAIKEWDTNYPGAQDTGTDGADQQPDLVNGEDKTRVSQIHALRKKTQALALVVGDDIGLPVGSLREKVAALEAGADRWSIYRSDTQYTTPSATYVEVASTRRFFDNVGNVFAVINPKVIGVGGATTAYCRVLFKDFFDVVEHTLEVSTTDVGVGEFIIVEEALSVIVPVVGARYPHTISVEIKSDGPEEAGVQFVSLYMKQ